MTKPERIPNVQAIANSTGRSRNAATTQLRSTVHASLPVFEPRHVGRQEKSSLNPSTSTPRAVEHRVNATC